MSLTEADIRYFRIGEVENPRFWSRLGGEPSFSGLRVLDLGCGHGSLCVDIASRGASKVVGLDLHEGRIAFAQAYAQTNHPELEGILEFRCCSVGDLPEHNFDIIVSKDTFEHIIGIELTMKGITERLKGGGRLYVGFGPLYSSPFGDHRRARVPIPWGHVILPEPVLIARLHRKGIEGVTRIEDLGLNKLTVAGFKKLFESSELHIVSFRVNVSSSMVSRVFSLVRRIPFLQDLFSHNLYAVLEKRAV